MIIDLGKEKKRRRQHIPDDLQKQEYKLAQRFRERLAKEISVGLYFRAKTRGLSDEQCGIVLLYEMIRATTHVGWVFDESGDELLLQYIAAELRQFRANEKKRGSDLDD